MPSEPPTSRPPAISPTQLSPELCRMIEQEWAALGKVVSVHPNGNITDHGSTTTPHHGQGA